MIELSLQPQCPSQCLMLWAFNMDVKELYKWSFHSFCLTTPSSPKYFCFSQLFAPTYLHFWQYCRVIVKEYGLQSWDSWL